MLWWEKLESHLELCQCSCVTRISCDICGSYEQSEIASSVVCHGIARSTGNAHSASELLAGSQSQGFCRYDGHQGRMITLVVRTLTKQRWKISPIIETR